mgnify:CR=1 FL=1
MIMIWWMRMTYNTIIIITARELPNRHLGFDWNIAAHWMHETKRALFSDSLKQAMTADKGWKVFNIHVSCDVLGSSCNIDPLTLKHGFRHPRISCFWLLVQPEIASSGRDQVGCYHHSLTKLRLQPTLSQPWNFAKSREAALAADLSAAFLTVSFGKMPAHLLVIVFLQVLHLSHMYSWHYTCLLTCYTKTTERLPCKRGLTYVGSAMLLSIYVPAPTPVRRKWKWYSPCGDQLIFM